MRTVRGHKPGALGDRDIAAYVDTRTQHHKVFQSRISRHSRLSNHQTATSDADIVTDLNQIVDLGTFADHGVADDAAVDGGASPNLDVVLDDNAPDLRHLELNVCAPEAETVLANLAPSMNDHAVPDQRICNYRAGTNRAVTPNSNFGPNDGGCANQTAGADFGSRTDHGARLDGDVALEPCARMHMGASYLPRLGQ